MHGTVKRAEEIQRFINRKPHLNLHNRQVPPNHYEKVEKLNQGNRTFKISENNID